MSWRDCRGELVLAERQRELPRFARQALENHLRVCDSCRVLRELGAAFDTPQQVQAGDAKRLDAMLAASEHWLDQPRTQTWRLSPRRRYGVALVVAAFAVTSVTAAAATIAMRGTTEGHAPTAKSWSAVAIPSAVAVAATDEVVRGALSSLHTPSLPSNEAPTSLVRRERMAEGGVDVSAEQLLRQASLARRNGNLVQASRLFQKLQQRYPNSRESKLSLVAFGTLLLETGQPAASLDQFTRYLATSSGLNLSAEALFGRGRALAQLARSADEQVVWRQLIERFPNSPYVAHARKRLALSP
jgi:TolA-binding protein